MSNLWGDPDYFKGPCLFKKILVNPWIFLGNLPWYLGFGKVWTPYI